MAKKPSRASPGRPSYRPSLDERMTVEQMKLCGEGNDGIARALGISTPTATSRRLAWDLGFE